MTRVACATQQATAAARVDLADHTTAKQLRIVRAFDHADELVPQSPLKARVAAHDLKIGVADTGTCDAHQRLVARARQINISDMQPALFVTKCFHKNVSCQWSVVRCACYASRKFIVSRLLAR